jgi:hypothetical protein
MPTPTKGEKDDKELEETKSITSSSITSPEEKQQRSSDIIFQDD